MSDGLNLELQLKLQDRMSAALKAALKTVNAEVKGVNREFNGLTRASEAWTKLGVRSERQIQREIKVTQAAYNRLERSGTLSSQALTRAKDAELKKIRQLNSELRTGLTLSEKISRTAQAGAALAAGAYVVKRSLDKPMDYDRQLALTANVAYSDRSAAGRIAGKTELNKAVRSAQQYGLGSQSETLNVLNELIGSGAMGDGRAGVQSSINLLPTIARAASGTGASPVDISKIVMASKQNMGMTDAEVKQFLSKAITAGNMGGFELKDMARFLPEQMALYAANGGKGIRGAEDLLAYNQVSRVTAGSADQAGNNMVNLLAKMNSRDTALDFKNQGIDLSGSLSAARGKGVGTLDAFMSLVDRVASKDPEYKKLQSLAATQQGGEQKQTFSAMMDIMEQKGIGSVVQDRQAMTALLGARQQSAKLTQIRNAVRADTGGQINTNFSVVDATSSAAGERVANAKDAAASGTLAAVDGPLKSMLKTIADVATANPILAASAYAAATALGAVAAASGLKGLLGGAGKAGGAARAGKLAGRVKGLSSVGRGLLAAGGTFLGSTATVATAGVAASGFLGYAAGTALNRNFIDGTKLGDQIGESVARVLAAFGNKEAQQALQVNVNIDGEKVATNMVRRLNGRGNRK